MYGQAIWEVRWVLSVCASICLYGCPPVHLNVCPYVCLPICVKILQSVIVARTGFERELQPQEMAEQHPTTAGSVGRIACVP